MGPGYSIVIITLLYVHRGYTVKDSLIHVGNGTMSLVPVAVSSNVANLQASTFPTCMM
jgi:hypothetical protein